MSGAGVEICAGGARALIARHGAELLSWRIGGAQLMWTPDAAIWDRVSPILFPVVGWCRDVRIRVAGQSYPMGVHGFAADCEFEIASQCKTQVAFVLRDNAATRTHYPFAFEFGVTYCIAGAGLSIELHVRNTGDTPMPYACGVHPGFRWPFTAGPREGYRIEFTQMEAPEVPVIAPGGLFSDATRAIALDGRRLALGDDTFAREALCFLNARSAGLTMVAPAGDRILAEFQDFPHLALWSKPAAPFVCVEAWTGHGDPVGFAGDLSEKPSMRILAPKEEGRHAAAFSWIPGS